MKTSDEKPFKARSVNVRLNADQMQWLKHECKRMGEMYGTVIRGLIREKMAQIPEKEPQSNFSNTTAL